MSRKMSLFEFWRSKKERGALLERADQLRLVPSQLKQLQDDGGVRAALQNTRMASLLPPVGTDVFRRFTQASLTEIQRRHEAEEKERENRKWNKEVEEKDRFKPASDLEAGKPLPFFYGDPPPELLNTPLEELDPYYQSQKTFIVLSKGNIIHRFNAEPACYLLRPSNPLRTVAIKILSHSLFRLFMVLTILTSSMFMTLSHHSAWNFTVKLVFTAIYMFELILKVVSRGFCVGKFTFVRDPWNWLDVVVIITGYVSQLVHVRDLFALWTASLVLKIIPLFSGLKSTAGALVQSVKRLAGVLALIVLCLSIFSTIGLQLFMGNLKQKCVLFPPPSNVTANAGFTPGYHDSEGGSSNFDFNAYMKNSENFYYIPGQLDALLCGNSSDAGRCPEGFTCMRGGRNPSYGYTSYDSFGWSLLSLIRLLAYDFWENLMMLTLRAAGKFYLAFFVLIVFPGSFFLSSLILVVAAMVFSEQEEVKAAEARQKEEEFSQIVEALKKREEEEPESCRAALSEKQNGESKESHEQKESGDQKSCSPCWLAFADLFLKWNCCGCWRWLKQWLRALVMNPFFDLGIVICLITNIIFMALEHYPMTAEFEEHLALAHLVFTAIFTAEMVIKIVALDPYSYFQVGWNVYDSIIVVLSLLELAFGDVAGLSVFRSVVQMRVFRLARWWPAFHMLLKTVWTSVRALRSPTILLLMGVFTFAAVGMQLFQQDYVDNVCRIALDCELPRWHMHDYFHSFLIIVRSLHGQWIEVLWDCMEVAGQTRCLIFFMMVVIIGNLLILNLFLSFLLSSFSSVNLVAPEEEEKNNLHLAISQIKRAVGWTKRSPVKSEHTEVSSKEDNRKEYLALNFVSSEPPVSEVKALSGNKYYITESPQAPIAMPEPEIEFKTSDDKEENKDNNDVQKHPEVRQNEGKGGHEGNTPEDCCSDECYSCCPFLDTSRGGGRSWSHFRRACLLIVQHRYFEIFIVFIILLSSVAMMFEDVHLHTRPLLRMVVETADQVFTYLFLLEMLLKWIAFGLRKYFTDAWCWLDFLVLDVFLVCLIASMLGFPDLGAFGSLRALGPLRALSRFKGARLVVQVLVRTVPSMCSALLVTLTVWLLFATLGVNLFAGKFFYCFNETSEEYFTNDLVNNKSDCFSLIMQNFTEVRWKSVKIHYDNVANGYLSLVHLWASEWMDIVYASVDSREVESQPVYEYNVYMYMYLVLFMISCFFTMIFFIRILIDELQKDKFGGRHLFMTEEQQKCAKAMKLFCMKPQEPVPRPQNGCQAWLYDLVTKPCFEVSMVVVICLNMATLMVETPEQNMEKEIVLYWLHFLFITIFFIEFILKIIVFRRHYFSSGWNILDFVVVIVSFAGLFISDLLEKYFVSPVLFTMFRFVRICRILHLIRWIRGVRKLLLALVMSLPALFNICFLLLIIKVTFSILGMFNFAYVKKQYAIDDMYNFETFWSSMICLLFISKSGGWSGLLLPIMNTPPDCDPYTENPGTAVRGDCGSPTAGIIFFTTHIFLSFLLAVHLYIAVILETFNSEALSDKDLQRFCKTWRKFDPDGSQFIPYSKLSDFCDALQEPLRIPKPNTIKLIHMDLPLFHGDKIHCVDVLLKLATQVLEDSQEMDSLKARMEAKLANSSKVSDEPISSTLQRKQEEAAATVIQKAYRKGLLQHGDAKKPKTESVDGAVSGSPHVGLQNEFLLS
uniref:sodium channel protein type 4 subunit alpha B-like n=1 Tax=Scatophagus argus TaxID=75038 RepID=UPI001ED7FFD6|nr:sodium channel protein type 4 subunit alpha B-like [Scatophagus argus]